jgi:hypothetical protein
MEWPVMHLTQNKFFFEMSGSDSVEAIKDGKKTVTFTASDGSKSKVVIPQTPNPNAVAMAGGENGQERDAGGPKSLPETEIRTGIDEQFATGDLIKPDKRDALLAAKLDLQTDPKQPGVTPLGVLQAKDEDFELIMSKRDQEVEANFQQWFATYFDRASPEEKEWARTAFPSFYQQRLNKLRRDVVELGKNAELKLMGIRTQEDLFRQYAIENGYIDPDPLAHIMNPEAAERAKTAGTRQALFQRGLLNPRRLVRGDTGRFNREDQAKQMVGRKMPYEAFNAGINGNAFTAIGNVDHTTETNSNYKNTFESIVKGK